MQRTVAFASSIAASIASGVTYAVFSISSVAQSSQWIAVGEVVEVTPSVCSIRDFGSATGFKLRVSESWKGKAEGDNVEFRVLDRELKAGLETGHTVVVAFIRVAVPCADVTYSQGILPIDRGIVDTTSLHGEAPLQPIAEVRSRFMAALHGTAVK